MHTRGCRLFPLLSECLLGKCRYLGDVSSARLDRDAPPTSVLQYRTNAAFSRPAFFGPPYATPEEIEVEIARNAGQFAVISKSPS